MGRIQNLEETVAVLDQRLLLVEGDEDEQDESVNVTSQEKIARKQARQIAIDKIQELYPDYFVGTASRSEGSGIKINKGDALRPMIIKYYHSRVYRPGSGLASQPGDYEHGWHIVRINEVVGSIYDLCIFSMCDTEGKWHFFLFTPDEIGIYNDENRVNRRNELWLYFSVQGDTAYELREDKIDVTKHLNNWNVIG